jgi:recombination protein RecA
MSMSKLGRLLKAKGLEGTHASGTTRHYLDTGYPPLNEIISGDPERGIPSGQLTMIAGPSACGKTMIATSLMISAQKVGGFAGMFDYETQYHEHLAVQQGLDVADEDKYVYHKPKTFEEGIGKAIETAKLIREENVIDKDAPIVFVFDSIHAMTPKSKWDNLFEKKGLVEEGKKLSMHDNYALSKASSDWFPIIQREFDAYGVTGIFLNQVREKAVMIGPISTTKFTFPGGDAVFYYCSNVIVLTATNIVDKVTRVFGGKHITAKTEKSRNTAPYQKVAYDFLIDKENETGNFDVNGSYAQYLIEVGAIEMSGPRVKWKGSSPFKNKFIEEIRKDKDGLTELLALHRDLRAGKLARASDSGESDDE